MNLLRIGSGFLFAALMALGIWMAAHNPLWNDEYYSLTSSTLGTSYSKILVGGIREGNNSPLFYCLQKLQCDVFSFHAKEDWIKGKWEGEDVPAQIFLRIQPVLAIALALSLLFYYFVSRYSLVVGVYALGVALSSFMLWQHWTEARPYALWFSLSMIQMLLLMEIFKKKAEQSSKGVLILLVAVHYLLALTAAVSMIQIAAAVLMLWLCDYRRWKLYLVAGLGPLVVCLFYYVTAPKYGFFFVDGPLALINANIPKDRLLIVGFFIAFMALMKEVRKDLGAQMETRFLIFLSLMLVFFALVLMKLKMSQVGDQQAFQISNRYFISLTPAGIIATVLFSIYMVRQAHTKAWRIAIVLILALLLAFRVHKTIDFSSMKRLFAQQHACTAR